MSKALAQLNSIVEAASYDAQIAELESEWDLLDGNPARRTRQIEVERELQRLRRIKDRFNKMRSTVDRAAGPGIVTSTRSGVPRI